MMEHIPDRNEFIKRMEYYINNGSPVWVSGRNSLGEEITFDDLKKAILSNVTIQNGKSKADMAFVLLAKEPELWHYYTSNIMHAYDFTIGTVIPQYFNEHLEETVGKENAERLNVIHVPARKYLVIETERSVFAMDEHLKMRKQAVPEWIQSSEYQLADAPEIAVFHADSNDKDNSYVELWLPIE